MKILYMVTLAHWGGVATYLNALIHDQVKRGNDIWLIAGTPGELTDEIQKQLPSVHVMILPTLKRNVHIIDIFRTIFKFRDLIKRIKPDIVHLNCVMAGMTGRLGMIGLHQPTVYTSHGWNFERGRLTKSYRIIDWFVEKFLSYFTNRIICISKNEYNMAKKYHILKNNHQAVIINNGSPDMMKQFSKYSPNSSYFTISMAARFADPKEQLLLIYAINKLVKKVLNNNNINKQIHLYLLGDGPNLDKCKNIVHKLKLDNNIIFTGQVNNVLEYYAKSDVVALISRIEGSPLSIIEAMSIGRPIVASNVGSIPELVKNNVNGICVRDNSTSIFKALYKLLTHPKLINNMASASYKHYKKFYNQKNMVKKTNIIYKRLL